MFPWFWIWNPQIHWPLSGSVMQDINPELDWFFQAIPVGAGKAELEKQIFQQYSYGKQLGIILEVLKPLAAQLDQDRLAAVSAKSLEQFEGLCNAVEEKKQQHLQDEMAALGMQLDLLKESNPEALGELLARYRNT